MDENVAGRKLKPLVTVVSIAHDHLRRTVNAFIYYASNGYHASNAGFFFRKILFC